MGWYRRRLDTAATRAFRLIPLSARARLSTSRLLGVRRSGVLQKEKMVRPLRLRPESAERKGGIKAGTKVSMPMWASEAGSGIGGVSGTSQIPPQHPLTHLVNYYSSGMTLRQ